jgi:hypothetical protein
MLTLAPLYVKMWRVMRMFDDKFSMRMAKGSKSARQYAKAAVSTPVLALQVALMVGTRRRRAPLGLVRLGPAPALSAHRSLDQVRLRNAERRKVPQHKHDIRHRLVLLWVTHVVVKSGDIDQAFSESGPLRYALLSSLQILLMSIPIMYITADKPETIVASPDPTSPVPELANPRLASPRLASPRQFVRASTIFLLTMSVIGFVLVPKFLILYGFVDDGTKNKGAGFISGAGKVAPSSSASNVNTLPVETNNNAGTHAGTIAMDERMRRPRTRRASATTQRHSDTGKTSQKRKRKRKQQTGRLSQRERDALERKERRRRAGDLFPHARIAQSAAWRRALSLATSDVDLCYVKKAQPRCGTSRVLIPPGLLLCGAPGSWQEPRYPRQLAGSWQCHRSSAAHVRAQN